MILGVDIQGGYVYLCARTDDVSAPEYLRFEFDPDILTDDDNEDIIWDYADEPVRNLLTQSDKVVISLPASICHVKLMEFDQSMTARFPDYPKWRASIHLPDNLDKFEYRFIPSGRSFDGSKMEMIFFATPRDMSDRIKKALGKKEPDDPIILIPEQVALTELLRKSVSKDDIAQAAIVNVHKDYCVATFVRDSRFFKSRIFISNPAGDADLASDVQTFLLSQASIEEGLPLVIIGDTVQLKFEWSPIVPVFLNVSDIDYGISWGLSEFAVAGGRCELPVAG